MNWNVGTIIAIGAMMIGSSWIWLSLHTKTMEIQNNRINTVLDEVERDFGTYDPDTAHKIPTMQRINRVTDHMRQQAEGHRRLLDSLTRMEREDLGDYTYRDTTENQFDKIRYDGQMGYTTR
ncbi:hypothetical protein KKH27_10570 [bacterium]|nr:hypothetical protein [bacterium]MBU1984099.1 hypothetical protein [bacterium]